MYYLSQSLNEIQHNYLDYLPQYRLLLPALALERLHGNAPAAAQDPALLPPILR